MLSMAVHFPNLKCKKKKKTQNKKTHILMCYFIFLHETFDLPGIPQETSNSSA